MDAAAILIFRALAGAAGKVEISGRRYTFSCIPTFRLEDDESGQVHHCRDSASLLTKIISLRMETGHRSLAHERNS